MRIDDVKRFALSSMKVAFAPLDKRTLRGLAAADGRLATAILKVGAVGQISSVQKIEDFRTAFVANKTPLVDGTLGQAGIYDSNQTVSDAASVSKPAPQARILYSLAREYQPNTVVELGTNVGISSAYIAVGLSGGTLATFEVLTLPPSARSGASPESRPNNNRLPSGIVQRHAFARSKSTARDRHGVYRRRSPVSEDAGLLRHDLAALRGRLRLCLRRYSLVQGDETGVEQTTK